MDKAEAHFIGGPRDGQSMFLRNDLDYYEVALYPEMSAANFDPKATVHECVTLEKFTYRRFQIQRETWVFIPLSWFARYTTNLEGYVMDYLVRGYIGNKR